MGAPTQNISSSTLPPKNTESQDKVKEMANSIHKIAVPVAQPPQHGTSRKAVARFGSGPVRRGCILKEETFGAMLTLERRRAERSRQPFILMLIDSSGVQANGSSALFNEKLSTIICGAVRESDLVGWYRDGLVLGVIFTEINAEENGPIAEVLRTKVEAAFRENLDHSFASKLVITVHKFPEVGVSNRIDQLTDSKLYPEVSGGVSKKSISMIVKRGIDIVVAGLLLLILSPMLAAIAIAIKLTSKGPVIFRQERLGQYGKSFQCMKFRTMHANNDPKIHREYVKSFIAGKVETGKKSGEAVVFKLKNDPRVTPVGRFLRKTSLDEFPQFWNVLRGEMSLVGPRPPVPYEFEAYDLWHRRRVLEVRPGVTGLWQVSGRSRTSFDDMVRMDVRYTQKWSLWLDVKILLATPWAVLNGDGAY
jgi:lipopolysaccharide/colanic/teichoic acid biosynthesis glycosyltransferase